MAQMIIHGDSLSELRKIKTESVDCCVTSPPYYGLRDYGVDGQIGLENTPEEYVTSLCNVFDEVRRVLKSNGTMWLVIGDSYAGSGKGSAIDPENASRYLQGTNKGSTEIKSRIVNYTGDGIKPKDIIGIPWMVAFELRKRGWYLRQDIIWAKPNPMPESVRDRCTKSHEYIFLLAKSRRYYFNAEGIAEKVAESTAKRLQQDIGNQKGSLIVGGIGYEKPMTAKPPRYGGKKYTEDPEKFYRTKSGNAYKYRPRRNKRDVWTVTTKPFREAHFATYPPDLIRPCIIAGCPCGGVVLDPFFGSGTTGYVATETGRDFIGIEINEEYCKIAEERLKNVQMTMESIR